ncbi:hypothetical protein BDN70DRAFT_887246 [Pholiota conissans]|uniref:Uncharacterized protein n=1 Tax=Pholiota conissans TaxID=109636 RepID=A0A9P6CME6_9AGAR|nr:hypothetical protein BDN70DRAFT_887246 [Pholiota conissans]
MKFATTFSTWVFCSVAGSHLLSLGSDEFFGEDRDIILFGICTAKSLLGTLGIGRDQGPYSTHSRVTVGMYVDLFILFLLMLPELGHISLYRCDTKALCWKYYGFTHGLDERYR